MMLIKRLCLVFGLVAAAYGELPSCYIAPYGAALNTTTCAPLDVQCLCGSRTFLEAAQNEIPQACPIADQRSVFSYIRAACNDFNVSVTLSSTNVPLTTSSAQTVTVTATPKTSGSDSSGECAKPVLSTGASGGLIVAAFFIGAIAASGVALVVMARRKSRQDPIRSPDLTYVGWHAAPMHADQSKQAFVAEVDASPQRSELMGDKAR